MAEDKEGIPSKGFTQIKPATIDLTTNSSPDKSVNTNRGLKQQILIWIGCGALLGLTIVAILYLPQAVNTPLIESELVINTANKRQTTTTPTAPKSAGSPWEQAQQSKLRKESQEILEKMLDAQRMLTDNGVTVWANDRYLEAVQHAEEGDSFYNERDFLSAHGEYDKALIILNELAEEIDDVFKQAMKKGEQALIDGDSKGAMDAFAIALAIDDIDRSANVGIQRAETLDELLALIDKGDSDLKENRLEDAKTIFQQALEMDMHSILAKDRIQLAEKRIEDREFNKHMSSGFHALENKQFKKAQLFFANALKLKPKSVEARGALNQTKHNIRTITINNILAQARKAETEERWHDALSKYKSALELDPVLAEAQDGKVRADIRTELHNRLEKIVNNPARLYDQPVYEETVSFLNRLASLANQGPVLSNQLGKLSILLKKAITPVPVRIQSDNLTDITIYKVGKLGYFLSKELSLKPGKYVVVGNRQGFRDTRIEFFIDPDKTTTVVDIKATDKIALEKRAKSR